MAKMIINVNHDCYETDRVGRTLTVSELVALLSEIISDDTPVYFGNDRRSNGWHTYGGITEGDFFVAFDEEE